MTSEVQCDPAQDSILAAQFGRAFHVPYGEEMWSIPLTKLLVCIDIQSTCSNTCLRSRLVIRPSVFG